MIVEFHEVHMQGVWDIIKNYPSFFSDEVAIKTFNDFKEWFRQENKGAIISLDGVELTGCSYLDSLHDGLGSINIIFKRHYPLEKKLELARQGIIFFFDKYNLKMLYGVTRVTNLPCIKFMKKLGFVFTEVLKEHKTVKGKPTDYVLGGLLKEAL